MAENNSDGVERRLHAPGSEQANAKELLAELVRLVESAALTPGRSRPPRTDTEPMQPVGMTPLRPSVEAPSEAASVDLEPQRAPESYNSCANDPNGAAPATGRRAGARTFTVSALILVGVAALGSIFWFKRAEFGLSNARPSVATAEAPAAMQPGSPLTIATSNEAGATLKDIPQAAEGKAASPQNQPVDPNARVSLDNQPQPNLAPKPVDVAQPTPGASAPTPPAAAVNTPAVAAPVVGPQPVASQSLDPKPTPSVSLPLDSTQIATPTPAAADSGATVHATDAPLPPVRPAPKAAIEATGVAPRSMSRLELPTKLSSKSEAHVLVAKAEANGPGAPADRSEPQHEASVKPEKGAKALKVAQAPVEAQVAPLAQPAPPPQQPNSNPVVHAFKNMVGAVAGFIPFVPH